MCSCSGQRETSCNRFSPSGHQACITGQQAPLLMEPVHIPIQNTLNIGFFSFLLFLRAWAFNA